MDNCSSDHGSDHEAAVILAHLRGRPLRFDWNKLLAKNERTADGYPFGSWDVIMDRVRLVGSALSFL
jgi:hypothetical protein